MTTANTSATRAADEALLRSAGLRVTAPRLATLEALSAHPHASAEHVIAAVRASLGTVSVQAVYDVLHALHARGLVQRIEPAGHPARYERRLGDNHHHVVCRTCGAVSDVDCATGHAPCLIPSNDHGFTIDTAEVLYWGTCPSCRTTAQAGATYP